MSPKKAPALQKITECHSSLIFMKIMANEAHTIPTNKSLFFLIHNKLKQFEKTNLHYL